MLWIFLLLGLAVIVGITLFGLFFGVAVALLGIAIKLVIVGAIVYGIIRIVSPNTAAAIRAKFTGHSTLPRW